MTPDDIKARITARRAEAVERRAIAEAATPGPWTYSTDRRSSNVRQWPGVVMTRLGCLWSGSPINHEPDAAHIAANDPATVIRDQDRIIAGCDRDAELLECAEGWHSESEPNRSLGAMALLMNGMAETVFANLAARYADTDAGAVDDER